METIKSVLLAGFCLLLLGLPLRDLPAAFADLDRYDHTAVVSAADLASCPDCRRRDEGTVVGRRTLGKTGSMLDLTLKVADGSDLHAMLGFWLPFGGERYWSTFPIGSRIAVERWGSTGDVTQVVADGVAFQTEAHPHVKLITTIALASFAGCALFATAVAVTLWRRRNAGRSESTT